MENFGVFSDILKGISGIDDADLYLQRSASRSLFFSDKKVEEVSAGYFGGCSARLMRGKATAFASVSGVESGASSQALGEACRIAGLQAPAMPQLSFPLERPKLYFPENTEFFAELDALLRRECSFVRQVTISCSTNARNFCVVDPDRICPGRNERASFAIEVILDKDGRVESGYSSFSLTGPAKDFFASLSPETVARSALDEALKNLEAVECPTGSMPVLLSGEAGGTIIHEACGHGMEADLVFEENSSFAGKIGERVAADCVTIIDDATIPSLYGSFERDDEGTPAQRTVLVENGILKNYLTDKRCARLYNLPLTGNGRRQSYASLPLPRMTNTFVADGDPSVALSKEEMLAGVPRGLYVCRMGGGEVNTTTGEFVFDVSHGYLIEDGRITSPVKGASLIGRGIEALCGVRAIGRGLHMEPGICGKEGQSLPVTDGQPSLLIDGLVVGGTAAE